MLDCEAKDYAWGNFGSTSAVARLKKSASPSFTVDEAKPYAELWMGTHPSGPAKLDGKDELLSDWLKANATAVGFVPSGYVADDLPYLFKVLSVRTALSIQAHPDIPLAKKLHSAFPNVYKDPNHKPEMALALTDFECMCGFRTIGEIKQNLASYPELKDLLTTGDLSLFDKASESDTPEVRQAAIRQMFNAYMYCPDEVAAKQLSSMIERLKSGQSSDPEMKELLLRLNDQYPGDPGVFAPLMLNFLRLKVGESFFIGANEPHAYISGDIIECMALSDNVVRAGLTPKLKDKDTLCSMLHYRSGQPDFLNPITLDSFTKLYRPPADSCAEFEVEATTLPSDTTGYHPPVVGCGSIILVTSGNAVISEMSTQIECTQGSIVFVGAGIDVSIDTKDGALIHRAHANLGALNLSHK